MVIGSAMFGAFLQEFILGLYSGTAPLIAIYTLMGFGGMLIVFWAILK
jgi:hypothetical protein